MTLSARTVFALALLVLLSAAVTGCASGDADAGGDEALTFAAVTAEQNIDPAESYRNLAKLLEEATGRKVNVVRSTDYNAVIEGMVAGKIDIAEFGPLSYVLAVNNGAEITPVAAMVEKGQPPTY